MDVEREVKPQPAGDSEASWSPGPRTTTKIPHFSDAESTGLADENETYRDLDLKDVSKSIDLLFGELPASTRGSTKKGARGKASRDPGFLNRASGAVTNRLLFFRSP